MNYVFSNTPFASTTPNRHLRHSGQARPLPQIPHTSLEVGVLGQESGAALGMNRKLFTGSRMSNFLQTTCLGETTPTRGGAV